jgi:excinuclease ABC subunit B
MKVCIDETSRRRKLQDEHNKANGIEPRTVKRKIAALRSIAFSDPAEAAPEALSHIAQLAAEARPEAGKANKAKKGRGKDGKPQKLIAENAAAAAAAAAPSSATPLNLSDVPQAITLLKKQMREAATELNFERAAALRDRVRELEQLELFFRSGPQG